MSKSTLYLRLAAQYKGPARNIALALANSAQRSEKGETMLMDLWLRVFTLVTESIYGAGTSLASLTNRRLRRVGVDTATLVLRAWKKTGYGKDMTRAEEAYEPRGEVKAALMTTLAVLKVIVVIIGKLLALLITLYFAVEAIKWLAKLIKALVVALRAGVAATVASLSSQVDDGTQPESEEKAKKIIEEMTKNPSLTMSYIGDTPQGQRAFEKQMEAFDNAVRPTRAQQDKLWSESTRDEAEAAAILEAFTEASKGENSMELTPQQIIAMMDAPAGEMAERSVTPKGKVTVIARVIKHVWKFGPKGTIAVVRRLGLSGLKLKAATAVFKAIGALKTVGTKLGIVGFVTKYPKIAAALTQIVAWIGVDMVLDAFTDTTIEEEIEDLYESEDFNGVLNIIKSVFAFDGDGSSATATLPDVDPDLLASILGTTREAVEEARARGVATVIQVSQASNAPTAVDVTINKSKFTTIANKIAAGMGISGAMKDRLVADLQEAALAMLRGAAPYTVARPVSSTYGIGIADTVKLLRQIDLDDSELLRSATVGSGVFNWNY